MSYLWMEHYLEEEDLKSAFENAVTNNGAYLIHFGTSTNDFACVCDEHTQSASNNTVKDIITKNYNRHDNLRVINVPSNKPLMILNTNTQWQIALYGRNY